jgi:predicted ATPase/DNA-binding winged helix-turn-helix (wHTH) protein
VIPRTFAVRDRFVDLELRTVRGADGEQRLTEREARLLCVLAAVPGRTVPVEALLAAGWDGDGTEAALLTALTRLRKKLEVPPADGPSVLRAVRHEGYALHVTSGLGPLPGVARSALLGRDEELDALDREARAGRVVTVLGPPGAGKTTLARALQRLRAERGGVTAFAELATAHTQGDVVREVAAATGAPIEGRDVARDVHGLTGWLGRFGLLVLDNGEESLDALAEVVRPWSAAVAVVVTSRVALGVPGELRIELGPLPTESARALFVRSAEAAVDGLRLGAANDVVDRIVERLDRLPLAILITAGHLATFDPRTLLARLDLPLDLMESGRRALPERHRTLRFALERSWELLGESDRAVLASLSVFPGSFTLVGAEAVFEASPGEVLRAVHAALDASLARTAEGDDGPRVALFEIVREFADDRLAGWARKDAVLRHAAWAVDAAERLVPDLDTRAARQAARALVALVPDLVAVVHRGAAAGLTVRAALAAHAILAIRGPYERLAELLDRAVELARAEVPELLPAVLFARGSAGDGRAADLEEGLALATASGDARAAAEARFLRVPLHRGMDRLRPGTPELAEAEAAVDLAPDPRSAARARLQLGVALLDFEPRRAAQELAVAADELGRLGDVRHEGLARARLGAAQRVCDDDALAEQSYRDAARLTEEVGDTRYLALVLAHLGSLLLDQGKATEAAAMLADAAERARWTGANRFVAQIEVHTARALLEGGDADGALAMLARADGIDDTVVAVPRDFVRARVLAVLGRDAGALAILDDLALVPERDHELVEFAAALRAVLLAGRGDVAAARAAVAHVGGDPAGERALDLARGVVAAAEGDLERARAALGRTPYDHLHDLRWFRARLERALSARR